MIYKKIGVGDFPEDICMLHKEATSKWVEKKGAQYFKETKRKRKSIDELEGVEDIILLISNFEAGFRKLGYYSSVSCWLLPVMMPKTYSGSNFNRSPQPLPRFRSFRCH